MFSTRFIAAAAAALSLISSATADYDKNSQANVALYYGSGPNQQNLRHFCDSSSVDIIPIGFINIFPNGANGLVQENFGNQCWAEGNYTGPGYNGVKDPSKDYLYTRCPYLQEDIYYCQTQTKKKILLSLGGHGGSYQLNGAADGIYLANFLWGAYGPYNASWVAAGGVRPLDRGLYNTNASMTIDIDGFDFDIEQGSTDNQAGYIACIKRLRELFAIQKAKVPCSKDYLISGAPQCPLPEVNMGLTITNAKFDLLFIQFYNNGGNGCTARNWASSTNKATSLFNYNAWVTFVNSGASAGAKLYIGLLGSDQAGTATDYIYASEAKPLIAAYHSAPQFGGVMLWEATYAENNNAIVGYAGMNYYQVIKSFLTPYAPAVTSTTVCSATSTSTSASSTKTSTSSFVTTTSSSTSSKPTTSSTSSKPTTSSTSSKPTTSSTSSKPTTSSTSSKPTTSSTSTKPTTSSASSKPTTSSTSSKATTSSSLSSTKSAQGAFTSSSSSLPIATVDNTFSYSFPTTSTTSEYVTPTPSSSSESSVETSSSTASGSATSSSSDIVTIQTSTSLTSSSDIVTIQTSTSTESSTGVVTIQTSTSTTSSSDIVTIQTSTPSSSATSASATSSTSGTSTDSSSKTYAGEVTSSTSSTAYTTSTVYTTSLETVTACPPTVTDCPVGSVVTKTIPLYTTVCPVTATETGAGKPTTTPVSSVSVTKYTTSTVYTTSVYTVTSCAPSVTDCPVGHVTTEIVKLYTTVCPVTEGEATKTPTPETPVNTPVYPGVPVETSVETPVNPGGPVETPAYTGVAIPSNSKPAGGDYEHSTTTLSSTTTAYHTIKIVKSTATLVPVLSTTAAPYPTGPATGGYVPGTLGTAVPTLSVEVQQVTTSAKGVSSSTASPVPVYVTGAASSSRSAVGVMVAVAAGVIAFIL